MARVIFLGTSGDMSTTSKQLRSSGGIILQVEDLQFHFDPGPGALVQASKCGVNLRNNTALLVTHNHINHCNDINAVIDTMTYSWMERRGVLLASKSVVHNTDNSHPYLTRHHQKLVEKLIVMGKDSKVGVDLVEVHSLPVEHSDEYAIGFKLFCPKFVLSYTGDTTYNEQLVEQLAGTDILIFNVPYSGKNGRGLNLDIDSVIKILSKVRPKLAVLTHFGIDMLKADPIFQAREVQRITGIQTISAKDGMILSPGGYNIQKSPVKGYD